MRWGILIGLLVLSFILEGTIVQVFSMNAWEGSFYILPRFALVLLVFISLFVGRRKAFLLGVLIGLLFDINYTGVIGVYAFSLALIPYLSALAYQYFQLNIFLIILTVFLSVYVQESITFFLYDLFGLARGHYDLLTHLPTAAFNALVALILYQPITRFLEKISDGRQDEERI
ncbi:rod shape-determining protein MreD [Ammoniphilus oxalaticus]|uniref:Rod shape-determining protein MreD n=1 Tax=Ammoniphilus oxalaticus TaxID=66863 RepID=A0A419SJ03_9BACL|nr:rod shape-determining protein MreD [Ammoniphilus oxalaticus]RKD23898.1 rod shape-determining protein MreD [Ammoniphilus oxalaticus]